MSTLVGALSHDAPALVARLGGTTRDGSPAERLLEGELALAWRPDPSLSVARTERVVCAVAGHVRRTGRERRIATASELAAAYAATGHVDLRELRGPFAVVVWDARRRQGFLAVDQLAAVSLVYRDGAPGLLFALELTDLLPLLDRRPPPNEDAVVQWLGNGRTPRGQTLFAGVDRLEGGQALDVRGTTVSKRRYWRPLYQPPRRASRAELEEAVRAAVTRAVEAQSGGDDSPGVLLSGGLDSAVVAAAAGGLAPSRTLRAFSLVFPAHPEVDEAPLIDAVSRALGLASVCMPFRGGGMLAASHDYLRAWSTPPVSPTLAVQRPLLRAAAADGATTLLDGQGGDELFGWPMYLLSDLLRSGRFRRAHRLSRRLAGVPDELRARAGRRALYRFGVKGMLPHRAHLAARRALRTPGVTAPPWLSAAAARTYAAGADRWAWKRLDGPRWWAQLADQLTAARERMYAHEYLRHRNALAGVRGGHPLMQDVDLIELVLRLPPELAFDARVDRPLLRSAFEGVVPDVVRLRSEKSYFTPLFVEAMREHDEPEVRRLLAAPDAEIRAYTDAEPLRRHLLDAPAAERGGGWAWRLWRLVTLECWLRAEAGASS